MTGRRNALTGLLSKLLESSARRKRSNLQFKTALVPTVVIGGLRYGGSGKTPAALWVVRYLASLGLRVGVLVRPTRRTTFFGEVTEDAQVVRVGDECAYLRRVLPTGCRLFAGRDLVALQALASSSVDVLVVDDGLRVTGLGLSLAVMMVDLSAEQGVFPLGPCRESLDHAHNFDVVWGHKSRSGQDPESSDCNVVSVYEPSAIVSAENEVLPLSFLEGRRIQLVSGIGDPLSFYESVRELNCDVSAIYEFGDHEPYSFAELGDRSMLTLTTEKDIARNAAAENVWALRVGFRFVCGRSLLESRLRRVMEQGA